jgi:hypothetical protein
MFDGKWGVEVKLLKHELLRIFHKIFFQLGIFFTNCNKGIILLLNPRDGTKAHDVVI